MIIIEINNNYLTPIIIINNIHYINKQIELEIIEMIEIMINNNILKPMFIIIKIIQLINNIK